MAKLISLMHLSFDGFAATTKGEMSWITHDQNLFEHIAPYISKVGTGVYGPTTFQMMESYWPGILKANQSTDLEMNHAKWYQSAKKVVCSRTLKHLENKDAR